MLQINKNITRIGFNHEMFWAFALVIALLMLGASQVQAQQTNARAGVTVAGSHGAGFASPIYGIEAGGTLRVKRVAIDGQAHYLWARKLPGGGHNTGGNLATRITINDGLFIGPAVAFARQTTNVYSKSAFSVGGEAGTARNGFILSGRALQDVKSANRVRAFDLRAEHYGSKRGGVGLYTAVRVGASQFKCFPGQCWSTRLFASAGIYRITG